MYKKRVSLVGTVAWSEIHTRGAVDKKTYTRMCSLLMMEPLGGQMVYIEVTFAVHIDEADN